MDQRVWVTIIWVVAVGTPSAAIYESWALWTGNITISRYFRTLAEGYHPVYVFAGIIIAFLFMTALFGSHLPVVTRAYVLAWLFIFGHIFWAFC